MSRSPKILIIDDHKLIIEGYKGLLSTHPSCKEFKIESAHDCDTAMSKIENSSFDLIILDISIPSSKQNTKITSGEELGMWIKEKTPCIKTIVITSHNDNYRINSILKNLNPNGFLIKSEMTPRDLSNCLGVILKDDDLPYYSDSVNKVIRKQISTQIIVDNFDIQILQEISNGTKNSELSNFLPLSKAAIEKRKHKLKDVFDILSGSDRELILTAKQNGFI